MRSTPSFSHKNHPESRIKSLSLISEKTPRKLNMPPFDKKLDIQLSKSISYFEKVSMSSIFIGPPPAEARGSKATKMQKAMLRKLRALLQKQRAKRAVFSLPPIWDKRNYQCTKRAMQKLFWKKRIPETTGSTCKFSKLKMRFYFGKGANAWVKSALFCEVQETIMHTLSLPLPP